MDSSATLSPGFDPHFPLSALRPAPYNPRRIDEGGIAALQESLRLLGVVRPILATRAGLIVAGHQRTRACLAEGITHAPVFVLTDLGEGDEISFNQLHNGTDVEMGVVVSVPPHAPGWVDVPYTEIAGELKQPGGPVRHEIHRLINRYGLWGGAVATAEGEVVSGRQYALACASSSRPCRVYYLRPDARAHVEYLARAYGTFDYSRLPSTPWHQTFCQPHRVEGSMTAESPLYREFVLPGLRKHDRLLDLGCGVGAYVRRLRAVGFTAVGWEPYPRTGSSLDREAAATMTRDLIAALARGPFDVGVADSVVNATGAVERSYDVCRALSAAVKVGGFVYLAGLSLERMAAEPNATTYGRKAIPVRCVHFFDENGFTAAHTRGAWMMQWACSSERLRHLVESTIGPIEKMQVTKSYWRLRARNTQPEGREVLLAAALREFDPVYPDGVGLGLAADVCAALGRNLPT